MGRCASRQGSRWRVDGMDAIRRAGHNAGPPAPTPQGTSMNTTAADPEFRAVPDLVHEHATARPRQAALVQGDESIDYGTLDALMDRVAAALQRDGVRPGDAIAICAHSSPRYAAVFLGALARRRGRGAAGAVGHGRAIRIDAARFAGQAAVCRRRRTTAAAGRGHAHHRAGHIDRRHRARRLAGTGRRAAGAGGTCSPRGPSTSSIPAAPPARPRASCSRTACAGRT